MSKNTKIDRRPDVNPATGEHKYGDVTFADPVNNKYPIDTLTMCGPHGVISTIKTMLPNTTKTKLL